MATLPKVLISRADYQIGGGPTFTVADLNVASVLSWARMGGVDLSGFPHVDQWLAGCLKRPAAVKARPAPMAK